MRAGTVMPLEEIAAAAVRVIICCRAHYLSSFRRQRRWAMAISVASGVHSMTGAHPVSR